jgi:WD40 repeat protein
LQISSEPGEAFFLAAIGPSIHKFDLVTKKLICEIKTFSSNAMTLFDKDQTLLVANDCEVRLWDLTSFKPTVIASIHAPFPVTGAYADKSSSSRTVCITGGKDLIIYKNDLENVFQAHVDAHITAVAFTEEDVLIGTASGKICRLNGKTGKSMQTFSVVRNKPVTSLTRFTGIKEVNVFLATIDNNRLFLVKEKGGKTEEI